MTNAFASWSFHRVVILGFAISTCFTAAVLQGSHWPDKLQAAPQVDSGTTQPYQAEPMPNVFFGA